MTAEKKVQTTRGQALADEYAIKFFEASAKTNLNVAEAFRSIAIDIKKRLNDNGAGGRTNEKSVNITKNNSGGGKCC